jgi:hypothetical protein
VAVGYSPTFVTHASFTVLDVPRWLNYVTGDILYTDGIVREENFNVSGLDLPELYNFHSRVKYPAYTARNDAGDIGREFDNCFQLIPPCIF